MCLNEGKIIIGKFQYITEYDLFHCCRKCEKIIKQQYPTKQIEIKNQFEEIKL
jgi:hypothetical protein